MTAQNQTRQAESGAKQTGKTERNNPATSAGQNIRNSTRQPKQPAIKHGMLTPIAKKDSHKTSQPQGKKTNRNFAKNPKPTNRRQ
jgi:hypothetical protein